uniref:Uncharacterized protein n=1 Tax=Arundo donax TaxID=35708 RepID=A0A0A9B918_ARUDO
MELYDEEASKHNSVVHTSLGGLKYISTTSCLNSSTEFCACSPCNSRQSRTKF